MPFLMTLWAKSDVACASDERRVVTWEFLHKFVVDRVSQALLDGGLSNSGPQLKYGGTLELGPE